MFIAQSGLHQGETVPPRRSRPLLAALVLLAAALLARLPGFVASVLDPDEGLYLLQADAWLKGGWPFVAVWDMHPLGAPAMLLAAKALIPDPVLAMRLAGVAAVAATAFGLRALALLLGAGPVTALAAGLLYIGYSTMPGGLATNTEVLFAPWVVLTAILLLGEARRPGPPRAGVFLAAGLATGVALLIKQVVALEASALWLVAVTLAWAAGRLDLPRLLLLALAFALGAGLPTGLVAAGYWMGGHFEAWAWGNLWGPLAYAEVEDAAPGFRQGVALAVPHLAPLALAAGALAFGARARRLAALPLAGWLLGAVASVVAPWKFWDHYFLILLPPLCLLAALGLAAAVEAVVLTVRQRAVFVALAGTVALLPVLDMLMPRLGQGIGLRQPDPPRQVAALARAALAPGQALYVVNWHPITYVLAGQAPPTRLAFPSHLTGPHAGLSGMDAEAELARLLALPPGVVVLDPARWGTVRPSARAAVEAALAARYELAGTVADAGTRVEVWRLR